MKNKTKIAKLEINKEPKKKKELVKEPVKKTKTPKSFWAKLGKFVKDSVDCCLE